MKYGLTNEELNFLETNLIQPLKQWNAKVYIFGSRATGKYKKFSDVDILFCPDVSKPIPNHVIYSIKNVLEESRFPYKVDLVNEHELASSFRDSVDLEKIQI